MKFRLVRETVDFLERGGFETCEYIGGCFDVAARRERLLLLKILLNIGSFQRDQARDLKLLSNVLPARPFVIGKKNRRENLREDVIYERFGIPAFTPSTFRSVVCGDYPKKIRTRGGSFGKIDPDKLKEARKEKKMTQSKVAERAGVTQKNISEHEGGLENISLSMLRSLEEMFGEDLSRDIDPFEMELGEVEEEGKGMTVIDRELRRVGFETVYTSRAPPQFLAKDETVLLSRFEKDEKKVRRFVAPLKDFSEISDSPTFLILEEGEDVQELPVITRDELEEIEDSGEVVEKVKEG